MNFKKKLYFCGSFLPSWIRIRIPNTDSDPDPLTRLNPDPIRIRNPVHLDVKAAVGAARPGEVHALHVLETDEDGRLVDEHKAAFEGVDEARGGLVGAGDGGGAGVAHEAAGDGDLAVDERLHQLGHQLKGGALHLSL
jgi:hypothetical protein